MDREFRKRDVNNKVLLAAGSFSPLMRDFIFDVKVPRPCRHFCGCDTELEKFHELLCSKGKLFVQGIAGIGKSELAKTARYEYGLVCYHDSAVQITNYTVLLTDALRCMAAFLAGTRLKCGINIAYKEYNMIVE